jgi:hypothetical protein
MAGQRRAREAPGAGAGGLDRSRGAVLARRGTVATLSGGDPLRCRAQAHGVLRLRVKDVDFGYSQITVRDGKGEKDRGTILPVGGEGAADTTSSRLEGRSGKACRPVRQPAERAATDGCTGLCAEQDCAARRRPARPCGSAVAAGWW